MESLVNMVWGIVFIIIGGATGGFLVLLLAGFLPRLINKLTPHIDEEKEILRGNRAVADYFSRVISASIIGASLVIAAAVLGGIIAALY